MNPQPIDPKPVDLQQSALTAFEILPLGPQPTDQPPAERKQSNVSNTMDIVPLDPSSAVLKQTNITTTADVVPLDSSPVDLHSSTMTNIETLPLDPSYTNLQAQTEPVIPLLDFSIVLEVFMDPIPVTVQQSAITTMINTVPVLPSYADMEAQTSRVTLPCTDAGAQVGPVFPTLAISSIEQFTVEPVPVRLLYTDTDVQTEPPCLNLSNVSEVSSSPTHGLPGI